LHTVRSVIQVTPDPRFAVSADYTMNRLARVGATRASLTTHLLGLETRIAANPRLQLVSLVHWNTAVRQASANVRLTWESQPLAFLNIVYNHRAPISGSGLPTVAAPRVGQLLLKWSWLLQF
jgi:hypothetical protein